MPITIPNPKIILLALKIKGLVTDIISGIAGTIAAIKGAIATAIGLVEDPDMNEIEAAIKTVEQKEKVSLASDKLSDVIGKIKAYLGAASDLKDKILGSAMITGIKKLMDFVQNIDGIVDKVKADARAKATAAVGNAKKSLTNNISIDEEGVTIPSPADIGGILADITIAIGSAVTSAIAAITSFMAG